MAFVKPAGRRSLFVEDALLIPASLATSIAPLLEHGKKWARDNGIRLAPELQDWVELIDQTATAVRARQRDADMATSGASAAGIPPGGTAGTVRPMRTNEVALQLACSPRWVRALVERGDLQATRDGGPGTPWSFDPADVDRYVQRKRPNDRHQSPRAPRTAPTPSRAPAQAA